MPIIFGKIERFRVFKWNSLNGSKINQVYYMNCRRWANCVKWPEGVMGIVPLKRTEQKEKVKQSFTLDRRIDSIWCQQIVSWPGGFPSQTRQPWGKKVISPSSPLSCLHDSNKGFIRQLYNSVHSYFGCFRQFCYLCNTLIVSIARIHVTLYIIFA